MNEEKNQQTPHNQLQIKATDEVLKGVYASAMQVLHTKQEFVLDFMNIFPPTGTLSARIIVSPAHLKQIIVVLEENLSKYEASFGKVEASETSTNTIGFQG